MLSAITLSTMLPLGTAPNEVNERLQAYHQLCLKRSTYAQQFGREMDMNVPGSGNTGVRRNRIEYNRVMYPYDALVVAQKEFAIKFGAPS